MIVIMRYYFADGTEEVDVTDNYGFPDSHNPAMYFHFYKTKIFNVVNIKTMEDTVFIKLQEYSCSYA